MKNIYRVTRPAWATMELSERIMTLMAGIALACFGQGESVLADKLTAHHVDSHFIAMISISIEVLISTLVCAVLIWWYKRRRVNCYPSTFLYCFRMPEVSNPEGRLEVVGFCQFKPDMKSGEVVVSGASFSWKDDDLQVKSRVGFRSTYVRGTEEADEETTCHIRFNINKEDQEKRLYRHGLLEFRLANLDGLNKKGTDGYAGYLQSTRTDSELQDVEVRSRGYAELYGKRIFNEDEIKLALQRSATLLFASLDRLVRTTPAPSIWIEKDGQFIKGGIAVKKTNCWGHPIPTPQSVLLNEGLLHQHIDRVLTKMLALSGVQPNEIEEFKQYAVNQARRDPEDVQSGFEAHLKRELLYRRKSWRMDDALMERARVISEQIRPYLVGDSLLDIGCGNGLICSLVRERFSEVRCLDVVRYLPETLNLPFTLYKEGEPLPIDGPFDTVLLLTVLHHSTDPIELLKMAWAATKKRLIIIESVVGIRKLEPDVQYDLVTLSEEDQIAFAAFVDWFYNRVLHDNIPVPYNFTTPERWQSVFLQHGMQLTKARHLGQDIDIGPEYHVLFVLDKNPKLG